MTAQATAQIIEPSELKELVTIEGVEAPIAFKMNGLDEFIKAVKEQFPATTPDLTTEKGRDEIRSKAFKIKKIKAAVEKLGKKAGEDARDILAAINSERNRGVEELQKFEDEIRKPLTDWEKADAERKNKLEQAIASIKATGNLNALQWKTQDLEKMKTSLVSLLSNETDWQEYADQAKAVIAESIKQTEAAISERETWDKEQAELAEFREAQKKRDLEDAEKRIAEEKKQQAEQKRISAHESRLVSIQQIGRKAADSWQQMTVEALNALKAPLLAPNDTNWEEFADRAAAAREEAVKQVDEAIGKLTRHIEEQKELARLRKEKEDGIRAAAEQKLKDDEKAKREADEAHRNKIILQASHELLATGLVKHLGEADAIITLIARGKIPHVSIQY